MKCMLCGEKVDYRLTHSGLCESCYEQGKHDQKKIEKIRKDGHTYHCACRQVWGDGECECDLYAQGYDPYMWEKNERENQE